MPALQLIQRFKIASPTLEDSTEKRHQAILARDATESLRHFASLLKRQSAGKQHVPLLDTAHQTEPSEFLHIIVRRPARGDEGTEELLGFFIADIKAVQKIIGRHPLGSP
jgi:hypothetical protein